MEYYEYDFCVILNLMSGMSYDEACQEAKKWIREARDNERKGQNDK